MSLPKWCATTARNGKKIAVIDTCVWLSVFISNKENLIDLLAEKEVLVYSCPELQQEIIRHLFEDAYFRKNIANPDKHLRFFQETTMNVSIDKRFDRTADAKDNFLFDLAYTVKSNYLVTSDKLLLNMKNVNKIHIISPAAYFRLFKMKW